MRGLWIGLVSALLLACNAPSIATVAPVPAPPAPLLIAEPAALVAEIAGAPDELAGNEAELIATPDQARADEESIAAPAATCVDGRGVERPAGHWMCRAIHGSAPSTAVAPPGAASRGGPGAAGGRPAALPAPYVRAIPCSSNSDDPRNPYDRVSKDQCTWWAWERRFQIGEPLPSHAWGDAKNWLARATSEGFATGGTPRAGAVMVCQPGSCGGAGEVGHVGYVEQVFDATTFQVSETNWGTPCYVDYRIVRTGPGVAFIYERAG
jgi:surface antigen